MVNAEELANIYFQRVGVGRGWADVVYRVSKPVFEEAVRLMDVLPHFKLVLAEGEDPDVFLTYEVRSFDRHRRIGNKVLGRIEYVVQKEYVQFFLPGADALPSTQMQCASCNRIILQ